MGCQYSTFSDSSSSSLACKNVRVVQLNGSVEHFDYPVSVSELTAKLPKHFVYTHSLLLCPCSKPLTPNTYLEPGMIYFLIPYSFFQSDFSAEDLVTIARKLTNHAKRSSRAKVDSVNNYATGIVDVVGSPVWRSPGNSRGYGLEKEHDLMMRNCPKSRSWKPILATIRERSFNRRSESDLQEKGLENFDLTNRSSRFAAGK